MGFRIEPQVVDITNLNIFLVLFISSIQCCLTQKIKNQNQLAQGQSKASTLISFVRFGLRHITFI